MATGTTASNDLIARARRRIADAFHDADIVTRPLSRGSGAIVWDVDGKRYIDYTMARGAALLGHADERVNGSVAGFLMENANLLYGAQFHELHVRLAETLCRLIPCADKVRFFKTGSCAASAAVRLTRLATGARLVLSSGYHGWHDWALQGLQPSPSEDAEAVNFAFDPERLESLLRRHRGRTACIFVTPEPNFFGEKLLFELRGLADRFEVPLVLDEVKTGFRFSLGGYQKHIGLVPDLAIFSKGLANGFSLSVLAGRRRLMDAVADSDLLSTYQGELASFVAAEKTLEILESEPVIEKIWKQGARLVDGLGEIFQRRGTAAAIYTHPPLFHIVFEDVEEARAFHAAGFRLGVLTYPFDNQILSPAHSDEVIDESLNRLEDAIAEAHRSARGAPPSPASAAGRVSRAALDLYTRFEFGGVVRHHPAVVP